MLHAAMQEYIKHYPLAAAPCEVSAKEGQWVVSLYRPHTCVAANTAGTSPDSPPALITPAFPLAAADAAAATLAAPADSTACAALIFPTEPAAGAPPAAVATPATAAEAGAAAPADAAPNAGTEVTAAQHAAPADGQTGCALVDSLGAIEASAEVRSPVSEAGIACGVLLIARGER
jgi:hypothetical protein